MSEVTVADVMSTDVLTTEPARTPADAAREMGEHNVGAVVVVDPERRRPQRLRARRGGRRRRHPRLLGEGRERLKSAGIFLGSFSRGLYAEPRKGQASDIERRRTGRLLRSAGCHAVAHPLLAGAGADDGARIEYGSGSLTVR